MRKALKKKEISTKLNEKQGSAWSAWVVFRSVFHEKHLSHLLVSGLFVYGEAKLSCKLGKHKH